MCGGSIFINISVSDTFRHILQHRKISHSIGAINHMSSNIAKNFGQKLGGKSLSLHAHVQKNFAFKKGSQHHRVCTSHV